MPLGRLDRGGKLARTHEQVVDEPGRRDRSEAVLYIIAQKPGRVGLVVHLMPDPDQRAVEIGKLSSDVAR